MMSAFTITSVIRENPLFKVSQFSEYLLIPAWMKRKVLSRSYARAYLENNPTFRINNGNIFLLY